MAGMRVFAAFGKEPWFRGYVLRWPADLPGNTDRRLLAAAIGISVRFGIPHAHQGPAGRIAVTPFSLVIFLNHNRIFVDFLIPLLKP